MAVQTDRRILKAIHLYDGCFSTGLNFPEIIGYLKIVIPDVVVYLHKEFMHCHVWEERQDNTINHAQILADTFARIKVIDPRQRNRTTEPLYGEIEYEKRRLLNATNQPWGIMYDGEKLQEIYNAQLSQGERGMHELHLILTNQLFGTWARDDLRYHARTSIYGIPCLISTSGLVEAPAKSRTYYQSHQLGLPQELLEKYFQGQFLIHDDPRLTEVLKGYIMQAVFYYWEGNPFCDNPECRLYNAHWQHELIHAQLNSSCEFCPEHTAALQNIRSADFLS
jgi:hypothetical protein